MKTKTKYTTKQNKIKIAAATDIKLGFICLKKKKKKKKEYNKDN